VQEHQAAWAINGHSSACSASCYACLRDYGNMAYHALLDWRLARDLFLVLTGGSIYLADQLERERRVLEQFCHGFDGATVKQAEPVAAAELVDSRVLMLRHLSKQQEAASRADTSTPSKRSASPAR
jgi:hypothetical protein